MSHSVESDFRRIGARAEVALAPNAQADGFDGDRHPPVRVDVLRDDAGPCFRIERRWCVTVNVTHVDVPARQLLLIADHFRYGPRRYSRFLCGYDAAEAAWVATPLPPESVAHSVAQARAAVESAGLVGAGV